MEGSKERLHFAVGDLIVQGFHYLCTNVTFASDQGQRQRLFYGTVLRHRIYKHAHTKLQSEKDRKTSERQPSVSVKGQ